MAEEKKEPWLNYLALATVILAGCATLSTFLLSSIAVLMKKKPVWVLGLMTGAFGIVYFVNGFWLFIK